MQINIQELVPKEWIIEKLDENKIKVYYINKGRGNSPKSFILPKSLTIDEEFIEGISMYIGDGKLSSDLHHLEFTSIDSDMIEFMLYFFKSKFDLKRHMFMHRKYAFQIGGKIFRVLFQRIIEEVYASDIYLDIKLRKAFLRGLFAAEGNIAINNQKNYVVCIRFCLNYYEDKIVDLVSKILDLEGITYKIRKKQEDKSMVVTITNWKNYSKLWKMRLFDLNQRKKQKFLDKVDKTKFFFEVKEEFINKLLNSSGLSHRQIAFRLGIIPTTLCSLNRYKTTYINKQDLLRLATFNGISIEEVKRNIIGLRVNRATIIDDLELVEMITCQRS